MDERLPARDRPVSDPADPPASAAAEDHSGLVGKAELAAALHDAGVLGDDGDLGESGEPGMGEAGPVILRAAGRSDTGLQREHNEDSFCLLPEYGLFVVADGMGGHRAGDVASRMATSAIASFFKASSSEDATWPFHFDPRMSVEENRLVTGIKLANKKIYDASTRNPEVHGMGTTVVGLVLSADRERLYVAHVGDSRCYRIREGQIALLTQDHSLLNDYLRFMPDMSQAQKDELPKNVITRALGMQDSVLVDIHPEEPRVGDLYVLCSDGLSGMVDDELILDTVVAAGGDVDAATEALIGRANAEGGEDNITAIVVALHS